jgi:hypothetical protein
MQAESGDDAGDRAREQAGRIERSEIQGPLATAALALPSESANFLQQRVGRNKRSALRRYEEKPRGTVYLQ